jgi:hypothetical protein
MYRPGIPGNKLLPMSYVLGAKCEIFDNSDFDDFYTIKSIWGADFWVKIQICFFFIFRGSFGAAKFLTRMLSLILRRIFFEFGQKKFFPQKLFRPFVSVNRDFLKFSMFSVL